jgi:hypothetical protein
MNNSIFGLIRNLWKRTPRAQRDQQAIDTLAAFVRDAEYDVLSVVTALQAHVDLLHDEHERNNISVSRFIILNRAIARIATDITLLTAFSNHVRLAPSNQKQMIEGLMQEIAADTQAAFDISQVSLVWKIPKGTTLIGSAASLKVMITAVILAVLNTANELETVNVIGLVQNGQVSMSVDTAAGAPARVFERWQLGQLHLVPANGDAISLDAIEAMARIHNGQFSVSTSADQRHGYRLTFDA